MNQQHMNNLAQQTAAEHPTHLAAAIRDGQQYAGLVQELEARLSRIKEEMANAETYARRQEHVSELMKRIQAMEHELSWKVREAAASIRSKDEP